MSISPAAEKRPSPAITLRGFYVPRQLLEAIEKHQEMEWKREFRVKMLVLHKYMAGKPEDDEKWMELRSRIKPELDPVVKWLGGNVKRMDDVQKISAFFCILGIEEAWPRCMGPLEAGLALSAIANESGMLRESFGAVQKKAAEWIQAVSSLDIGHYIVLAAAVGDPRAIRLIMFLESTGRVSGIVEKIEAVLPEAVERVRKEIEEGRKASGT